MNIANHLESVKAIISITDCEQTALSMSRINSKLPIFILSKHIHTLNTVTLYRGVVPIYFNQTNKHITDSTRNASKLLRDQGFLLNGELVIIIQNNIKNKFDINSIIHILKIE